MRDRGKSSPGPGVRGSRAVSDGGKKVGVIGAVVAALGGIVAHGADDCARLGARGAAVEAVGVRAAGNVGDDLGRAGVRAGAKNATPRVAALAPVDDLSRVGARAGGLEGELGFAALGDEVASGAKPWKTVAEEVGQEVSANVLGELLDAGEADDAAAPRPPLRASGVSPARVALVPPTSARGFAGYSLPATPDALYSVVRSSAPRPIVVVGYLPADSAGALLSPNGDERVELATLHARAAAARATVWVLGCPIEDPTCLDAARRVVDDATRVLPGNAVELGRALVRARDRGEARALSVHGLARTRGAARMVHSRL